MLFNMTIEEWDAVISVHLRGAFCVIRPAAALMRAQKSTHYCLFFWLGSRNSGQANYSAAKAGILGLIRTAARDLGKYGITANSIWPSAATRMTATVPEAATALRAERGLTRVSGARPQIRDPKNVAPMVAYLASDLAANITGQTFAIGESAWHSFPTQPRCAKSTAQGGWTMEKMLELFPNTIGAMELRNL